MREIKFRGISLRTKNFVYGYYYFNALDNTHWIKTLIEGGTQYEDVQVIEETVGQYANLKDKNGVEIYEGDIVKYDYSNFMKGQIYFDKKGFWGIKTNDRVWNEKIEAYYHPEPEIEIIGNIYENPELLTPPY